VDEKQRIITTFFTSPFLLLKTFFLKKYNSFFGGVVATQEDTGRAAMSSSWNVLQRVFVFALCLPQHLLVAAAAADAEVTS